MAYLVKEIRTNVVANSPLLVRPIEQWPCGESYVILGGDLDSTSYFSLVMHLITTPRWCSGRIVANKLKLDAVIVPRRVRVTYLTRMLRL